MGLWMRVGTIGDVFIVWIISCFVEWSGWRHVPVQSPHQTAGVRQRHTAAHSVHRGHDLLTEDARGPDQR